MKTITFRLPLLIAFAGVFLFSGCKKDDPKDDTGNLTGSATLRITNVVNGNPIELGRMIYTNAAGNNYQVDMLRYYLTNVTFVKSDGTTFNTRNYDLVNEEDSSSKVISLSGIPDGEYSAVRFLIGIDSTHNNGLDQTGDLDPSYGMYWAWSTDYIFYKHEGFFIDNNGTISSLHFHLGTAPALTTVTLPASISVHHNQHTISLNYDINASCSSPNVIDFNIDNNHQSTSATERGWIDEMRQNISAAFQITSIR